MTKEKNIKVIIVEPNKAPREEIIVNDLKVLQGIVGGYVERMAVTQSIDMLSNEEGKMLGLEPNFATRHDVIVGNVVFVSHKNGEWASLTDSYAEFIMNMFGEMQGRRNG